MDLPESYYELIYGKGRKQLTYDSIEKTDGGILCSVSFNEEGYEFKITDRITQGSNGRKVERHIEGRPGSDYKACADGIRFSLILPMETDKNCRWRFCSPSIDMTKPRKMVYKKSVSYVDADMAGAMFGAYNCDKHIMYSIFRTATGSGMDRSRTAAANTRARDEMAALGYEITGRDQLKFMMSWPMTSGYYLMGGADIDVRLNYSTSVDQAPTFADGMYEVYRYLTEKTCDFSEDAVRKVLEKRIVRLKDKFGQLYSAPEGMAESFSGESDLLRYGLTDRELKISLFMAVMCGGEWMGVCERMVDSFISECVTSGGFVYTIYDRRKKEVRTDTDGNYLRAMSEAAYDVLCAYRLFRKRGIIRPAWFEKVRRFMDFLVRVQNLDGSWFQAYHEDGSEAEVKPVKKIRMEVVEGTKKAATAIPLGLVAQFVKMLDELKLNAGVYRRCAEKSADYVLKNNIRFESYMGGDPLHPDELAANAARYSMMGLYNMHCISDDRKYLDGAVTAARMFVIWNSDIPCHCIELYRLGKETGEELFCQMTDFVYMSDDKELL